MKLREIFEGVTQVWGKSGNKMVRKYRCTSGQRKGRVVAKASTCSAPLNVKKSGSMKRLKGSLGKSMSIRSSRTKRANKVSKLIRRHNRK